jgi:hydroxymethylpyrimidine pyrophosphatase-like HAD family hydrolase
MPMILYRNNVPYANKKSVMSKLVGESQGQRIAVLTRDEVKDVNKMFFGSFSKSKVSKLRKIAESTFGKRFEISQSSSRSVEFNALNVNKANGLKVVAKLLGLSGKDFAVFGDGGNDIEMFK